MASRLATAVAACRVTRARCLAGLLLLGLAPTSGDGAPPGRLDPARGRLLVASRDLVDPNFARTVVLLLEYDDGGAMGVIVNRPTPRRLDDLRPHVETERTDTIYLGGPVLVSSLLVLTRARAAPAAGMRLFADVHVLTSRDAVEAVLSAATPHERLRFFAGHAGWAGGQLDAELRRGDWHVKPATADVVFADPHDDVWERLIAGSEGQWTRRPAPDVV